MVFVSNSRGFSLWINTLLVCWLILGCANVFALNYLSFINFSHPITLTYHGRHYKTVESGELIELSDRLIIKTAQDILKTRIFELSPKIVSVREIFIADTFRYFSAQVKDKTFIPQVLEQLQKHKDVLLVQPDLLQLRQHLTNTSVSTSKVNIEELRGQYPDYLNAIRVKKLQTITHGQGIKIAIIDDGFSFNHPAIKHKSPSFAYDLDGLNMSEKAASQGGKHGTMVASILFSHPSKELVGGIAPEADFIALRHTDTWTSKIILSFYLAHLAQADIINCSWRSKWLTEPVADVVNYLANKGRNGKGSIVVFAAGNDGKKIGINSTEASLFDALVIGATDAKFQRMKFSSFGESVDVTFYGGPAYSASSNGEYRWFRGTSLAAAIATGMSALLLAQDPTLTAGQLSQQLQQWLFQAKSLSIQDNNL